MMAEKMVVCVATISEGNNKQIINELKKAIEIDGIILLNVAEDPFINQTIFTYGGCPEDVLKATTNLCIVAHKHIDMKLVKGSQHLGTMSDCGFIPVRNSSISDCENIAYKLANTLENQHRFWVFDNYEGTYDADQKTSILKLRSDGYEKFVKPLRSKINQSERPKDTEKWGATIAFASQGFVHFKIDMLATKEQALRIALDIQEIGRSEKERGPLKGCLASASWDEKLRVAQITLAIRDVAKCPLHSAVEEVEKSANALALPIIGCRVVGLLPLKSLLDVAEHYIKKDNLFVLEEDHKISLAVSKLSLNSIEGQIIEYLLPEDASTGPLLINKSLKDFIRTVGARIPVPAGGSVAAAVASLGAALSAMVAKMTYGKKQWEKFDTQMRRLIPVMHYAMEDCMRFVDEDTDAFNELLAGLRLPKDTPEQESVKKAALDRAVIKTIEVPLAMSRSINSTWTTMEELAPIITAGAISDLRVSAWCLQLSVKAAHSSIVENVRSLKDEAYKQTVMDEIESHLQVAKTGRKAVHKILAERHH